MRKMFLLAALCMSATPALTQTSLSAADQQRAQARYEDGWRNLAAEAWEAAAKDFQGAVDIDPKFKLAYYGIGKANMGLKKFDRAALGYEKCRDLYATQFGARMSGRVDVDRVIADDSQQLDMAIQQLSRGTPSAQKAVQIAQLESQKQRLQNKGHGLENLSLSDGVPPFVSLALGSAYFRAERLPDAETAYKAAIIADPKTGEAHNNLAVVYLETGRLNDADKEIKAAEKAGFRVNEHLKDDIKKRKSGS